MAFASVDLRPGVDAQQFVSELDQVIRQEPSAETLEMNISEHQGRCRLAMFADYGNVWLGYVLANVADATGAVERAILGLDHDEFGCEHVIFGSHNNRLCRVQHVYVYPGGEPSQHVRIAMANVPVWPGLEAALDGTIDGPQAWAQVADVFDVSADRIAVAAQQTAHAHEYLGMVFSPVEPWWNAIGVTYPVDLELDITLGEQPE